MTLIPKIVLGLIIALYSLLFLYAFLSNKELKKSAFRLVLCIVSCGLILISNIGFALNKEIFIWTLCTGLLLMHALAVMNGYLLHKRPNWSHHIIRLVFSALIVLSYIKYA